MPSVKNSRMMVNAMFTVMLLGLSPVAQAQSQLSYTIPFAPPMLLALAVAIFTFLRIRSSHKK